MWAVLLCLPLCGAMELTLLHTADLHSHVQPFNARGDECTPADRLANRCFGGLARLKTAVRTYREKFPQSLLLDPGDQLQGTLWFTVLHSAPMELALNEIGYDATGLGVHEFDQGLDFLASFLRNLDHKAVSSNAQVQGTALSGWVRKSLVLPMGEGEKVGLLAYITPHSSQMRQSSIRLRDEIEALQEAVRELETQGVDKIIVLGHSGLEMDRRVCAQVRGVDVIIGGFDHSLLFNGETPTPEATAGSYPVVVNQTGSPCLIVHAGAHGKYLGLLQLSFDDAGSIARWAGNPVLLDDTFPEDPALAGRFDPLLQRLDDTRGAAVGETAVGLHYARDECRGQECNLGNLVTDAAVDNFFSRPEYEGAWTQVAIGLWNSGGIGDFDSSEWKDVTLGDVRQFIPHTNDMVDLAYVYGKTLREMMENSVSRICNDDGRFLQVSGLRVLYDLTKSVGNRVIQLDALCSNCSVPRYETVHPQLVYPIATSTFMMHGALGFGMLARDQALSPARAEVSAMDAVLGFIKRHSPLKMGVEGRIRYIANLGPDFHCKFIPDVATRPKALRKLARDRAGVDLLEPRGVNDQRHKYVLRFSQEKNKLVYVRQPNLRLP